MSEHTSETGGVRRRTGSKRWSLVAAATLVGVASITTIGTSSALQIGSDTLEASEVEVFVGLTPTRLLDTRIGLGVPEAGPLGPGESITVDVAGVAGVPAEATSVAVNTTYPAPATSPSFLTIWPTGQERPFTAVNNASPGIPSPNFVIAALGDGGRIDVYNDRGSADVVLDVAGYYVPLSSVSQEARGGALLSGTGAPAASLGLDGDFYIDETTTDMYGPKRNGTWPPPLARLGGGGTSESPTGGSGGSGLLTGETPPDDGDGDVGDIYIDLGGLVLYGPKTTTWGTGRPIGPDGIGSTLLTGSGDPLISVGIDGDRYLDLSDLELFGPKSGGTWGSGTQLTDTVSKVLGSALGVIGVDLVLASVGGKVRVPFATGAGNGTTVGTAITQTDADTFTFNESGTYKVSYTVSVDSLLGVGQGVEVHIDGTKAPGTPTHPLLSLGGNTASGTVLVHADQGQTLELVLAGISLLGGSAATSDLTVELIALD